jgi:MFS transporter, DHA1 family, inner membrane transport protein
MAPLAPVAALGRSVAARPASWYGYAAFVLALPYPALRVHWALGGTLGLASPGAAGKGWEPLLIAIPWALAAILSPLLARPPQRLPQRFLLMAGWSATAIVAMIGPAAFWSFVSALASGADIGSGDIAAWVFALFYGSWFFWAIASGAATRAYQLRTAALRMSGPALAS